MADYQHFPLTDELVERFKAWQAEYDDHEPVGAREI